MNLKIVEKEMPLKPFKIAVCAAEE